jgi:two-component system, OmpR family, sensor kinase
MRRPLSVRARLLLATVGVVTLALSIGVTAFNLFLAQRLDASATATAKAEAVAELSSLHVAGGRIISPEGPEAGAASTLTWVFQGGRAIDAPPRAKEQLSRAAGRLAGAPEGAHDVGESARLFAIPVVRGGTRYGTVVAAVSLGPYQETAETALIGSIALAGLLLATMTALSWWMLGRALLPVQHMTESAAQWSEYDLDHRLDLGEPRDEFTRLAATLDGLLERIAESLRHEQRFTAEISHELRTPLARVKGETELMLSRPRRPEEQREALEEIARSVDEMTTTVETLVAAARHEAGLAHETSDLRDAVQAAASTAPTAGHKISVTVPPESVRIAAELDLLTRMLQPLVDNACRYGRSVVDIEVTRRAGSACVDVRDDGPGVGADEADLVFEPGRRGHAATTGDGAGLGLALARRLARSVGGEVLAEPSSAGGHVSIHLPVHP